MHRLHRVKLNVLADPPVMSFLGVNATGQKFVFKRVALDKGKLSSESNVARVKAAMQPHVSRSRV
jgi:hypothetical protein